MRKERVVFVICMKESETSMTQPNAIPIQHTNTERANRGADDIVARLAAARPRLRRIAQLRGVAPDAIEDVVQETLFEAWKHLDRLHTPNGLALWLDEICRNVCRRAARTSLIDQRHRSPLLALPSASDTNAHDDAETSFLEHFPDPSLADPLDALDRQETHTLLDQALGSLPPQTRELVELCYLMDLPQREVAARLGLSISALESRLHRARQQLRQALDGPLRAEAEALDLPVNQESAGGWRETRLWCTLCGRRRLMGLFVPQPDGSMNLHMRCPDCERLNGLIDSDNSNVHSKGLVRLDGLQSFRPAWKRTMENTTAQLTRALSAGERRCPSCGTPASLQLVDKAQAELMDDALVLPAGLSQHPYQFWIWWRCPRCQGDSSAEAGVFAASDLVYWSDARTRQFMGEHPHWVSEPELLVEHAGLPAIRFQMADRASAARLTIVAHRYTLHVLATF